MQALIFLLLVVPSADPAFQPPRTAEAAQEFFVGHWKLEANEDDLKASIDYLTWRAKGVDDQGKPIAPTPAEIKAAHDLDLKRRVEERAKAVELSHLYYSPQGRMYKFTRYSLDNNEPDKDFESKYSVDVAQGKVFLTMQAVDDDTKKSRIEVTILDANRYRVTQMGTKIALPMFAFTYQRVDAAPPWCDLELEDKLEEK
jgi:hypothetical protein